jgi:Skp family chaperone for outer membrane proteins
VEEKNRNIQTLTESTKHAIVHAEILETSHKQLSAEYRARFEASKKDLTALREERDDHRSRLARLDVANNQMKQELERTKKSSSDMMALWDEYQETSQEQLQSMERRTAIENDRTQKLNEEMTQVVNEMRWVMGLKKNLRVDSKIGPSN